MSLTRDPRVSIIRDRIRRVRNIISIASYKGGVGKTIISSLLSIRLSELSYRVGVLDLDFTNPSIHIVLGVDLEKIKPSEEKGVIPPDIDRLKLMTIAYYARENPTPLRGLELVNVFRELMSVTLWGELDFLIIDTPPGFSDVLLELSNNLGRYSKLIIISTPSRLSLKPLMNLYRYMREIGLEPLGVVLNLFTGDEEIKRLFDETLSRERIRLIGLVGLDHELERSIGSVDSLKRTKAYRDIINVTSEVLRLIG